ncbi:MAG TPA: cyclic nucleotide-binding domain-containing protein [Anaerolineales bacterium]|nr:cyclic nucleotide-binding domain-containing protein [Anaerolineales bacterium]
MKRPTTFDGLKEEYFKLLEPLFEPFSCRAGETVIQQGAQATYLYIILSGKAEVSYKPYDAPPITVSHVEEGGLFGWSAVVGSEKYTSSVRAIADLEAVRLYGNDLRKLCAEHPEAGRAILERLAASVSSRWHDAYEQVKSILGNGMKQ